MKYTFSVSMAFVLILGLCSFSYAKKDKEKSLPPGLVKKVKRGGTLPPGWQKKLIVGKSLDKDIFDHGKIIATDSKGLITISVEGKLIKLVKDTREIVEILSGK
jgi:hypothetical protein